MDLAVDCGRFAPALGGDDDFLEAVKDPRRLEHIRPLAAAGVEAEAGDDEAAESRLDDDKLLDLRRNNGLSTTLLAKEMTEDLEGVDVGEDDDVEDDDDDEDDDFFETVVVEDKEVADLVMEGGTIIDRDLHVVNAFEAPVEIEVDATTDEAGTLGISLFVSLALARDGRGIGVGGFDFDGALSLEAVTSFDGELAVEEESETAPLRGFSRNFASNSSLSMCDRLDRRRIGIKDLFKTRGEDGHDAVTSV